MSESFMIDIGEETDLTQKKIMKDVSKLMTIGEQDDGQEVSMIFKETGYDSFIASPKGVEEPQINLEGDLRDIMIENLNIDEEVQLDK